MERTSVNLAEAKARLSELTELAATGEEVVITKRGKPVVKLSKPDAPRCPVDLQVLRNLTAQMPLQPEESEVFIRRMREDSRY